MRSVTLRSRLLLSALSLSLATTFLLSLVLRRAWQNAEKDRFEQQFRDAVVELSSELSGQGKKIEETLDPLCAHDPIVDSALVGLESDTLDSRLLSLRARIPELERSLGLSELSLITSAGLVVAGTTPRELGTTELLRWVVDVAEKPRFREEKPRAFEGACIRRSGSYWVALIGSTHLEPLLARAGRAYDLELSLVRTPPRRTPPQTFLAQMTLPELDGAVLVALRSRKPLRAQLRDLDLEIASATLLSLGAALILALFLSRGLARPVIAFARSTREAVTGDVHELPETGGPELAEAARAFNHTLQDLRDLRKRLIATERIAARREVARQVAHEIKNPLSPIRTSLETLRKIHERGHPQFDELFEETTKTMLEEVQRLTAMVAHFSEYARLPSPRPAPLDLKELMDDIASLHEGMGATIFVEGSPLPKVFADRDQIAQVLTNLIKNALEATKDGASPKVWIRLQSRDPEQRQSVVVEDNGPGILADQEARLFEPYATTKKQGSGLGLPISHRIAVEHGGDLTYRKAESGGACFELTLPTQGPPRLADRPQTQAEQPT